MKDNNFLFLDDDGDDTKNAKIKEGNQDSNSNQTQKGQKFEERLKLNVFNIFCYLLKTGLEITPWKIYLLVTIEFIQFLQFSFHPTLIDQWKDFQSVQYISIGSQVFSLRYWLEQLNISWNDYLITFYVVVLFVFFIIINFMYASFSVNNQGHQFSFTWPLTLLQYICLLMVTVLFQPTLEIVVSMLACQTKTKVMSVAAEASKVSNVLNPKINQPTTQVKDQLVLSMFNEIVCFEGTHILHACISIIVSLVLISLALLVVFLYFESRKQHSIILAKIHARVDFFVTILKLILVIVYNFLQDESFTGFKILVLVVISTITFIRYMIDRPFYIRTFNKIMSVVHGIFAWTNYMILLGAVLGNARFNMLLFIYLLGIPIIIVLILTSRADAHMKILLTPVFKFQKGEEALTQVVELVHLIQTKETNRESAILIKGFVNYHEMTCVDEECSLKQYKKHFLNKSNFSNISNMGSRHIQNNGDNFGMSNHQSSQSHQKFMSNESNSLLLNFTKRLLEKSIRRFPKCTILKITYSSFLLDHMGNKREAMRELNECSKLKPSLDQQFIIFRYKKLIGDSLLESGKESGGFEYISAVNFDANFRKCKQNIERSALLHFEFWNHLQEDSPDLKRLMDLGIRIDQQLKIVEYHWEKMQQIYPNTPKAVKLYAMFLIEVVNDKEAGNELLQKAKDSSQIRTNFEFQGNAAAVADDMGGGVGVNLQDGSPLIYISGENDRMGLISNINLSACRVFGFLRKEELLNKNIKILMPPIYSQNHDEFVRSACMKSADQITNKERSVFGRHTSGYIFPVSLQIKYFQSFLHGKQFAATLKTEKKAISSSVAYLIIDSQGKVLEASSSAVNLLDIDKNSHQHQKKRITYDLTVLIDGLLKNETKSKYLGKQGDKVVYHYPEIIENNTDKNANMTETTDQNLLHEKTDNSGDENSSSEEDDGDPAASQRPILQKKSTTRFEKEITITSMDRKRSRSYRRDETGKGEQIKASEEKKQNFICNMFQIAFSVVDQGEVQGYSVRLELSDIDDEEAEKKFIEMKQIQDPVSKKFVRCSDFQFSFSPIYKKFVRELKDDDNKDPLIDQYYLYVKAHNMRKGEESGDKLTVMKYLNIQKAKMEHTNDRINDHFIQEVDEYSEEDHSESGLNEYSGSRKNGNLRTAKTGFGVEFDLGISKYGNDDKNKNMQKRINDILNSRYVPHIETADTMYQRIQEITEILKEKSKSGENIKTYRVFDGEITLVEEVTGQFLIKNTEHANVEAEDMIDEDQEEDDEDGFKTSLKSRKAFQSQLNDRSVPPPVKKLQYTANIVLLIFVILSIIEYSIVRSDLQNIGVNYTAIQNRFQLISEMQRSSFHSRSLVLYAKGIYNMSDNQLLLAKADMKESLNTIYSLQSTINLQKLTVSEEHQKLLDQKVVQMYFKQQENTADIKALNFSLTEGLLQISSSLFTLTNLDNRMFDDKQDDVFYFLYNNFQDTLISMFKSANYFVKELDARTREINEANKIVFYLSIGCIFTSVLMLIPVVHIVNKTKQKYLEIFLELDNNNIRKLSGKCEKYMNMVQDESNEELNSNDEELEDMARGNTEEIEDEYAMQSGGRKSRRKKSKNTISNKRMFVIKFVIGMMIIEVYFLAFFIVQQNFLTTCNIIGKELNTTAYVEPFFWFSLNAQRELYSDSSKPVIGMRSFDVSKETIAQVQQLGSEMQQEHLQNMAYADDVYNTQFSDSMQKSVCNLVDSSFSNYTGKACEKFISGSTTQGLHSVIVRYEEGLRKTLSVYQTGNRTAAEIKKLLNTQDINDLFFIQRFITSAHMQTTVQTLQDSIQLQVSSNMETRLSIFTIFIVALLFLFVVVWIPFINGLSTEVHQTKRILLLIPIELLMGLKNVAALLATDKNKMTSTPPKVSAASIEAVGTKKAGTVATD